MRNWTDRVPSISQTKKGKVKKTEKKVPIDPRKFAIKTIKDQGLAVNEMRIMQVLDHVKKEGIELYETHVMTTHSEQFLFGGVSLAPKVDNLFDLKSDAGSVST